MDIYINELGELINKCQKYIEKRAFKSIKTYDSMSLKMQGLSKTFTNTFQELV